MNDKIEFVQNDEQDKESNLGQNNNQELNENISGYTNSDLVKIKNILTEINFNYDDDFKQTFLIDYADINLRSNENNTDEGRNNARQKMKKKKKLRTLDKYTHIIDHAISYLKSNNMPITDENINKFINDRNRGRAQRKQKK